MIMASHSRTALQTLQAALHKKKLEEVGNAVEAAIAASVPQEGLEVFLSAGQFESYPLHRVVLI